MKALNTVKITFPSRSVNEGFARSALSAFAAQADPTLDELADKMGFTGAAKDTFR